LKKFIQEFDQTVASGNRQDIRKLDRTGLLSLHYRRATLSSSIKSGDLNPDGSYAQMVSPNSTIRSISVNPVLMSNPGYLPNVSEHNAQERLIDHIVRTPQNTVSDIKRK
jgi:hypothetical protein